MGLQQTYDMFEKMGSTSKAIREIGVEETGSNWNWKINEIQKLQLIARIKRLWVDTTELSSLHPVGEESHRAKEYQIWPTRPLITTFIVSNLSSRKRIRGLHLLIVILAKPLLQPERTDTSDMMMSSHGLRGLQCASYCRGRNLYVRRWDSLAIRTCGAVILEIFSTGFSRSCSNIYYSGKVSAEWVEVRLLRLLLLSHIEWDSSNSLYAGFILCGICYIDPGRGIRVGTTTLLPTTTWGLDCDVFRDIAHPGSPFPFLGLLQVMAPKYPTATW